MLGSALDAWWRAVATGAAGQGDSDSDLAAVPPGVDSRFPGKPKSDNRSAVGGNALYALELADDMVPVVRDAGASKSLYAGGGASVAVAIGASLEASSSEGARAELPDAARVGERPDMELPVCGERPFEEGLRLGLPRAPAAPQNS